MRILKLSQTHNFELKTFPFYRIAFEVKLFQFQFAAELFRQVIFLLFAIRKKPLNDHEANVAQGDGWRRSLFVSEISSFCEDKNIVEGEHVKKL